jgi:hypothetical protein
MWRVSGVVREISIEAIICTPYAEIRETPCGSAPRNCPRLNQGSEFSQEAAMMEMPLRCKNPVTNEPLQAGCPHRSARATSPENLVANWRHLASGKPALRTYRNHRLVVVNKTSARYLLGSGRPNRLRFLCCLRIGMSDLIQGYWIDGHDLLRKPTL